MSSVNKISYSVFTKPWKDISIAELGQLVSGFGFDGIEFPLREGYQVDPARAEKELPQLARQLTDYNLQIFSVASSPEESVFAACAEAGIPMIRIMADIDPGIGYVASEAILMKKIETWAALCEKYTVKLGIQQHHGDFISDSAGLRSLVESFDPKHAGAVWDAAHDALAGQQPAFGLDMLWEHLAMVNLKNAYYVRTNGPEAEFAEWKRHFTTGRQGLASWPAIVRYLKLRKYEGIVCLTAQYEEQHRVNTFIQEDLNLVKSLFAEN